MSSVVSSQKAPVDASGGQIPSTSTDQPAAVVHKLAMAKRRMSQLEGQKDTLEVYMKDLETAAASRQEQLEGVKLDLQDVRTSCAAEKQRLRELESDSQREIQRRKFASTLLELGTTHSYDITTFLDASEEEIIGAIRKAAEREGNIWCTILSEVTGPLAPDNYISAINIALDTRKELRSVRKVARFWKRTANVPDTVTPSASNLSDMQEPLSSERRRAVESLQRRRQSFPTNFSIPAMLATSASAASQDTTALPYLSSAHSIPARRHDTLAPLASQVFKEELMNAHANSSLFSSSSSKTLRPKAGPIEKNKPSDTTALPQCLLPTEKDVQQSSHQVSTSLSPPALPNLELPSPIANVLWSEPKDPENTFLQAERALHSFERICNSFPSSNFGSLHAISEENPECSMVHETLVNASCAEPNPLFEPLPARGTSTGEMDTTVVGQTDDTSETLNHTDSDFLRVKPFDRAQGSRASLWSQDKPQKEMTASKLPRPTSVSFALPAKQGSRLKSVEPLNIVKKNGKRSSLSLF
ncbi:hypothetical protein AAF712_005745 [Marasmius tenuissimus]|uniref:Uncharacterized protein n=1 Tax=Marasmius tenuissimus TaxID=585030 RepID=A0ABR3A0Y7_9AGAR